MNLFRTSLLTLVCAALVLTGCNSTPYPAAQYQPVYQQTQPAPQQVMAQTCIGANNMVVDDQYCDPNYIAQQRMIAQQQHNDALLTALLLYHAVYTSNPYNVGVVIPMGGFYTHMPYGYTSMRRSVYVNNIHNHTIIVNNGRAAYTAPAPARPVGGNVARPVVAGGSYGGNVARPSTPQNYTPNTARPTSTVASNPGFGNVSRPAPSFSRPAPSVSRPSVSSSSFSSNRRR
jgi:hypothetical protein